MELGFHAFPSGKKYVFLRHPTTGQQIFLRNILFLRNAANPKEIAIVREWGGGSSPGKWEPPKGQMEWKELAESGIKPGTKVTIPSIQKFMAEGMRREMAEEAKILPSEISGFHMLPMHYMQAWPESGLPNAAFMYQYWGAQASPKTMLVAQKRMATVVESDLQGLLPPDMVEKDGIRWWSPAHGWDPIRGGFSKKMTAQYFEK